MFTSTNVFEKNRNDVSWVPDFNRLLKILTEIRDFLNKLGYLWANLKKMWGESSGWFSLIYDRGQGCLLADNYEFEKSK